MTKIPLREWYAYLEQLLDEKTGYIYGTAGVLCTQKVIDQCIARFPKNADITRRYGPQWIGHNVTDCSGVPLPIAKKYGIKLPHGSTSLVLQGFITECGPDPHPGWAALADPTPDTPDNNHIGYVGMDGETIYECRGTKDGFVKSSIHDKRWTKYGRMTFIDYGEGSVEPLPDDGERVFYRATVTTKGGKLNVRSGPGTDFDVIHQLPNGTVVDVMFVYADKGWAFIDDDGDQGYVSMPYLAPVSPSEADKKADDETPAGDQTPQPDESQAKRRTILRNKDNNITIELGGEWDVYAMLGGD